MFLAWIWWWERSTFGLSSYGQLIHLTFFGPLLTLPVSLHHIILLQISLLFLFKLQICIGFIINFFRIIASLCPFQSRKLIIKIYMQVIIFCLILINQLLWIINWLVFFLQFFINNCYILSNSKSWIYANFLKKNYYWCKLKNESLFWSLCS